MLDVLLDMLIFVLTGKKRKKDGESKIDLGLKGSPPKLNPGAEIVNLKKQFGTVRCANCGKEMKTQAISDQRAFWCPKCYDSKVLKTGQPIEPSSQ
jgi:DNA-directed RNA polymerase subunit RPC12/RpoP